MQPPTHLPIILFVEFESSPRHLTLTAGTGKMRCCLKPTASMVQRFDAGARLLGGKYDGHPLLGEE